MKVFISIDMEGITGTTLWQECQSDHPSYQAHVNQMTNECLAACEGAIEAGAVEIVVRDAHNSATNIDMSLLPKEVKIIRQWSGHPYSMVDGIDSSFDAVLFVGYHGAAGNPLNPLSHTMTGRSQKISLNGLPASEFLLYSYAAALEGVPTVFASGDEGLCAQAKELYPNIRTVSVKSGKGGSVTHLSPNLALDKIRNTVRVALSGNLKNQLVELPNHFEVNITFKEHIDAKRRSYYPGMIQLDANTIQYSSDDYFDVLRMIAFVL
ncbi:MAG: hypothetical protein BGO41_06875 [Clostridiales bacterium 38-18]|nr:MAG: hypothetical protein BGO41_06875 [Clostridiales bacterium 38-18]